MESLAHSEYFNKQQQQPAANTTINTSNKATNTDINYNDYDTVMGGGGGGGGGELASMFAPLSQEGNSMLDPLETLPVYSITLKTQSLRRPKSTTFSDWRGQISGPRSAGLKSGLGSGGGLRLGEFSPMKRPKSTPYFDIKIDNVHSKEENVEGTYVKVKKKKSFKE